ncbi:SOS response-associated peptidase [Shewanella mangrovisoli]|uniref:SOS response-associated peptidase n=1 Tax=Shewanella mangrovisoli TaxID=2864211 RepID=UPI0035B9A40C
MCGRLSIDGLILAQSVKQQLGVPFNPQTNLDLRPTEQVSTLVLSDGQLQQQDCTWGIKPAWSKSLLINAQSETVTEKKTFAAAFAKHRCLVPCFGWYEWRDEGGKRKQKYLFSNPDDQPLYMAGIFYPFDDGAQLVTLTTSPTEQCRAYHSRMPLLIDQADIGFWFQSAPTMLDALLRHPNGMPISIQAS